MNTRDTAVRVCGMLRCAKICYRTRTHATRFLNTTGLPIPVLNPRCGKSQPTVYLWKALTLGSSVPFDYQLTSHR